MKSQQSKLACIIASAWPITAFLAGTLQNSVASPHTPERDQAAHSQALLGIEYQEIADPQCYVSASGEYFLTIEPPIEPQAGARFTLSRRASIVYDKHIAIVPFQCVVLDDGAVVGHGYRSVRSKSADGQTPLLSNSNLVLFRIDVTGDIASQQNISHAVESGVHSSVGSFVRGMRNRNGEIVFIGSCPDLSKAKHGPVSVLTRMGVAAARLVWESQSIPSGLVIGGASRRISVTGMAATATAWWVAPIGRPQQLEARQQVAVCVMTWRGRRIRYVESESPVDCPIGAQLEVSSLGPGEVELSLCGKKKTLTLSKVPRQIPDNDLTVTMEADWHQGGGRQSLDNSTPGRRPLAASVVVALGRRHSAAALSPEGNLILFDSSQCTIEVYHGLSAQRQVAVDMRPIVSDGCSLVSACAVVGRNAVAINLIANSAGSGPQYVIVNVLSGDRSSGVLGVEPVSESWIGTTTTGEILSIGQSRAYLIDPSLAAIRVIERAANGQCWGRIVAGAVGSPGTIGIAGTIARSGDQEEEVVSLYSDMGVPSEMILLPARIRRWGRQLAVGRGWVSFIDTGGIVRCLLVDHRGWQIVNLLGNSTCSSLELLTGPDGEGLVIGDLETSTFYSVIPHEKR